MMYLILVLAIVAVRFQVLPLQLDTRAWAGSWWSLVDVRLGQRLGERSRLALVVAVPPALLFAVIWLFHAAGLGFLVYLLSFLVLVICFDGAGRNEALDAYLDDLRRGDVQAAYHHARDFSADGVESGAESWSQLHAETLGAAGLRGYESWFPVIFWFVLLGIPGAVLYRLAQCLLARAPGDEVRNIRPLAELLHWLPVRLFGLSLALAGNFRPVMDVVTATVLQLRAAAADLAVRYVGAALGAGEGDSPAVEIHELEELPALVDRALVIWIAVAGLLAVLA